MRALTRVGEEPRAHVPHGVAFTARAHAHALRPANVRRVVSVFQGGSGAQGALRFVCVTQNTEKFEKHVASNVGL